MSENPETFGENLKGELLLPTAMVLVSGVVGFEVPVDDSTSPLSFSIPLFSPSVLSSLSFLAFSSFWFVSFSERRLERYDCACGIRFFIK